MAERKDNRDPALVGENLLRYATKLRRMDKKDMTLSEAWDDFVGKMVVPDYNSSEGPVEKYGGTLVPVYETIRVR